MPETVNTFLYYIGDIIVNIDYLIECRVLVTSGIEAVNTCINQINMYKSC